MPFNEFGEWVPTGNDPTDASQYDGAFSGVARLQDAVSRANGPAPLPDPVYPNESDFSRGQRIADPGPHNRATIKQAAGEQFGVTYLKDAIAATRPVLGRMERLSALNQSDVGNIEGERRRISKGASSNVAQQFQQGGGSFRDNLAMALKRNKARQGIALRGDAAIRNQQMKDRVEFGKSALGRKAAAEGGLAQHAKLEQGVMAANTNADILRQQSMMGAFGTLAGAGVRGLQDYFANQTGSVSEGVDTGTATADYMNMGGFDTSLDPANIGMSTGGEVFS